MTNLAILRKQKKITQKELAQFLNISQGNLCDWEKGRSEPDIKVLIKLSQYFETSIDYIVGNSDKVNDNSNDFFNIYNTLNDDDKNLLMVLATRLSE